MKKSISVLILLALVTTGAFAQIGLSAGGGLLFDGNFGDGLEGKMGSVKHSQTKDTISFGGFVFFDATYAEIDIAFLYGTTSFKSDPKDPDDNRGKWTSMQLGFSLLGKYPIEMGPVTIFPLLGINYNMLLEVKDKDGKKIKDNEYFKLKEQHQLGFLAGVGVDYPLNDNLYLRGEALFSLRLPSKSTEDYIKNAKDSGATDVTPLLGLGPRIKVGVGYRF